MRKIKEVKVTVPASVGSLNTSNHLIMLNRGGSFTIEAIGEEDGVADPNEIVLTVRGKRPAGRTAPAKPATPAPPPPDPLKDFFWIWNTMSERTFSSADRNTGLNGHILNLTYPPALEGGGLAWIEPFYPEQGPINKLPNGYFIAARGVPKILSAVWREYSENNDGRIINGNLKKFNQSVQLHVYTQGLYGHDVLVNLMDRDVATANDLLMIDNNRQYGAPVAYFTSEVRVYEMLPDEKDMQLRVASPLSPSGDGQQASKHYVQKTILNVLIEKGWIEQGGERLKIFPEVQIPSKPDKESFSDVFINVQSEQKEDSPLTKTGNNPVVVDQIPTDIAAFKPCKYTAIELSIPEKNEQTLKDEMKVITLFQQGGTHRTLRPFEVVTGETSGLQKIKLTLHQLQTLESDCSEQPGNKHKGRVLKLIDYPESTVDINNPKSTGGKSDWSGQGGGNFGLFGVQASTTQNIGHAALPLEISQQTDSVIEFNARHIYKKDPVVISLFGKSLRLPWILRYFWIGKNVQGSPYIVQASTCRHRLNVMIYPYPDVAWEMVFQFKVSGAKEKPNYTGYAPAPRRPVRDKFKGLDWSFDFSLKSSWNGGEKFDVTADLKDSIFEKLKTVKKMGEMVTGLMFGEHNSEDTENRRPDAEAQMRLEEARQRFGNEQNTALLRRQEEERVQAELQMERDNMRNHNSNSTDYREAVTRLRSLTERATSLKRDLVGFDIVWPELNATFKWQRVNTRSNQRDDLQNLTGVMLSGHLEASPLIGLEAYFDFLALVQRLHPIALAVIAAVDLAMHLIGDGSKIVVEFRVKGTVGGKLQGFLNTLTLENSFNGEDRAVNGKPAITFTGALEFSAKIEIKIEVRKDYVFVSVQGGAQASITAVAKFSARAQMGSDEQGFFTEYFGTFEGLEVIGKVKVEGDVSMRKAETPSTPANAPRENQSILKGGTEGEIKYQAIDKMDETQLTKLYFGLSE
ncbi:hypothetical protein PBAL39_00842 [Pedobacter sp. BAL39]|uniref:hypothetical protein n=1 Tax=Pedobacter sp. BAL39 TaxID=391596 RepID=UPI0001559EA9|nr:hypothetical protein [Pedobacter sp. BAL39]EDM38117.1 hypothetical protein PBAL39_00842 [Pedobacter sp. BAL39]